MNSNRFFKYIFTLVATVLMLASATPAFAISIVEDPETTLENQQEQAEELVDRTEELTNSAEDFFTTYDEAANEMQANSEGIEQFFVGFTLFTVVIFGLFGLIGLGLFVFNIAMIIDCAQREFEDKTVWLIVLIVGLLLGWGGLAAVVYYFVAKRSQKSTFSDGPAEVQAPAKPVAPEKPATPAPSPEANK